MIAEIFERLQLIDFFKSYTKENFESEVGILLVLQETFLEGEFRKCKNVLNEFKKRSEKLISALKSHQMSRSGESPL